MQVLLPGRDPVEVKAYAPVDARMQAASLLNVDIAEVLDAKVAVENKPPPAQELYSLPVQRAVNREPETLI